MRRKTDSKDVRNGEIVLQNIITNYPDSLACMLSGGSGIFGIGSGASRECPLCIGEGQVAILPRRPGGLPSLPPARKGSVDYRTRGSTISMEREDEERGEDDDDQK